MVYVAEAGTLTFIVNVPLIEETGVVAATPPVYPEPVGVGQVYRVPAGTMVVPEVVGVTLNPTPEQVAAVMAWIDGLGWI